MELDNIVLKHYGTPRRSGRYKWGSGKNPFQRSGDFLSRIDDLKKQGLKETEIAESLGLTTFQLRIQRSVANSERRSYDVARAKNLRAKGYSLNAIAKELGYKNESSIRSLLDENSEARMKKAEKTAEYLKAQIDEKGIIDVGAGVERQLGISSEKLNQALYILEMQGYNVYGRTISQVTNAGRRTVLKVITSPEIENKEIYDFDKIKYIDNDTSFDGGETFTPLRYPTSMDSNRLSIRYAEDGGDQKDGVIEIRRGVDDLSLGNSNYAQVRILVDDNKYLKGMAVYSDDLPDGVDIVFNTNKKSDTPKDKVLKDITSDPNNPFGALIKANGQSEYTDKNGNKKLSLINKRAEEGDWDEWEDKLASQFLSKQSQVLIKRQLGLSIADRQMELDEILSLNNPTIKRNLLKSFAEDCDAAAIHLKAAALPRQRYHVILPVTSMKDNEVYAPNYENGEKVALVRYPHGGTFEIPTLVVNNKQKDARKMIGNNSIDAIGINSKVAQILSGADFDGDTVMVIPTNSKTKIVSTKPLKDLVGFDPKMDYGATETKKDKDGNIKYYQNGKPYKIMRNTQNEMGVISNLITDMTLKGAREDELARAVKHSMVVIDAEKHKLNYKQSYIDNNIETLKKDYQAKIGDDGKITYGASTLISRAKSQVSVLKRQGQPNIDPTTGKQTYKEITYVDPKTGKTIFRPSKEIYEEYPKTTVSKTGKVTTKMVVKKQQSTAMAETDDAFSLSSGTIQEKAYAEYANKIKAFANTARKELYSAGKLEYKPAAKKAYEKEVKSLDAQLHLALLNAPKERRAQIIANSVIDAMKKNNPDMTKKEIKKQSQMALTEARIKVGAKKTSIKISDKEWEAIQAGAISDSKLYKIIENSDIDIIRKYAMPKTISTVTPAKESKIKLMSEAGSTNAEIAKAVGLSTSTISDFLRGKE